MFPTRPPPPRGKNAGEGEPGEKNNPLGGPPAGVFLSLKGGGESWWGRIFLEGLVLFRQVTSEAVFDVQKTLIFS